jgi:hypothetical protein
MTELLKKTEEKKDLPLEELASSAISLDNERIKTLINVRKQKLEAIRNFISLKLYGQLTSKLELEEKNLLEKMDLKKKEVDKQNREQSLPKSFFEQRYMKIKTIRID